MIKQLNQPIPQIKKPWYNKPLIGETTLVEKILSFWNRKKIPEDMVKLHKEVFLEATNHGNIAEAMDDIKFNSPEFLFYLRIVLNLQNNLGSYAGLFYNYQLCEVAFNTRESFIKIEEIEFKFRGRKQQEFYQYVEKNLNLDRHRFNEIIDTKSAEILPELMTCEGADALLAYKKALNKISNYNLGLRLLARFKKYEMNNFTILKKLGEVIETLTPNNLLEIKNCELAVKLNKDLFERLGVIIEMPEEKSTLKVYAQMIQYIALGKKHEKAYPQFRSLIKALQEWENFAQKVSAIRESFPPQEYKQPREFTKEIPGLKTYKKYEEYMEIVSRKFFEKSQPLN